MATKDIFTFPNPVNEVSARVVAAGVVAMAATTVATRRRWLLIPLAYGFVARALSGPTLSPLGQLATRLIVPRLPVPPKETPGPPKRFAQTIGAVISLTALVLAFGFRRAKAAYALIGMIGVFATLESGFGFCVGCEMFKIGMRLGLIPEHVCVECANIWGRASVRANPRVSAQIAAD